MDYEAQKAVSRANNIKKVRCNICNDTGENIIHRGFRYPGDCGLEPDGGGSIQYCECNPALRQNDDLTERVTALEERITTLEGQLSDVVHQLQETNEKLSDLWRSVHSE